MRFSLPLKTASCMVEPPPVLMLPKLIYVLVLIGLLAFGDPLS